MTLATLVKDLLMSRSETLAVAESCTGGGLANEITQIPGVSSIFLGGIVTYANEAKVNLLHIPRDIIANKGAVSQEVAFLMAQNCRSVFQATWALATTGIAGPSGGSPEKPVGLVWIGLAGPSIVTAQHYIFSQISRQEHRHKTIEHALILLEEHLK